MPLASGAQHTCALGRLVLGTKVVEGKVLAVRDFSLGRSKSECQASLFRQRSALNQDFQTPCLGCGSIHKGGCKRRRAQRRTIVEAVGGGPSDRDDLDLRKKSRSSRTLSKATKLGAVAEVNGSLDHLGSLNGDAGESSWSMYDINLRIVYSMAMYGGLALAGKVICSFADVDFWGGFHLSFDDFIKGFLYALPPICFSSAMHQDSVVDRWPPARAIRDAEDEQLVDFFIGMQPVQIAVVAVATAFAEELFFRSAVQGGLAHAFRMSGKDISEATYGIAALTGVVPTFAPFAQALAAVLTGAITGSMFYVLATPKDPTYVIAPVRQGGDNKGEVKRKVEMWFERRMLRKIYTPLVEALMSLYFGCIWLEAGNLLVPMVAHASYYAAVVVGGVDRFHGKQRQAQMEASRFDRQGRRVAVIGRHKPGSGRHREVSLLAAEQEEQSVSRRDLHDGQEDRLSTELSDSGRESRNEQVENRLSTGNEEVVQATGSGAEDGIEFKKVLTSKDGIQQVSIHRDDR